MALAYTIFFWSTLGLYALVVAAQIYAQVFARPRLARRAEWLAVVGLTLHTALVLWRWLETGHVPVIGSFENALLGGWFIVLFVVWAGWDQRYPLLAAGALPLALLILAVGGMSDRGASPLVASLQSFWLYVHIFFAWLAYGAYTVGCGAGVVYLVRSRRGVEAPTDALRRLDELMFRATAFGFINDAVMIASGSIWAKNLWGSYWGWDPVETWSLLSWLIYGMALHFHIAMGWRGQRMAWVLVFAIIGVLISFWGVNWIMAGSAHVFNVD